VLRSGKGWVLIRI